MNSDSLPIGAEPERILDLESLKGLAHPLRAQIVDALSTYGSATASGLAERLGESSGATSYHLRQLAKHGFVREVVGKGVGRERWWERSPGGITLASKEFQDSAAGKQAASMVANEWGSSRESKLRDFMRHGLNTLPDEWIDASLISLTNVFITAEQLGEFTRRYLEMATRFAEEHRGKEIPGSRPVHLQFHGFPVVDGVDVPLEAPSDQSEVKK